MAMPIDLSSFVTHPLLYYLPLFLSLAVFFYAMIFRIAAGGIMRPLFTALVLFSVFSAFQHALYFSQLDQASITVGIQAFSTITLVILLYALARAKRLL